MSTTHGNKLLRCVWALMLTLTMLACKSQAKVPELVRQLRSGESTQRVEAAAALGKLGPKAAPAIPHLLNMVERDEPDVVERAAAVKALGMMGPVALPALKRCLREQRGTIGTLVGKTLVESNSRDVSLLIEVYHHQEPLLARAAVVKALASIGNRAVPALVKEIGNKRSEYRCAAIRMLGALAARGEPDSAIPALVSALGDKARGIKECAMWALGDMGVKARPAVSGLVDALSDPDASVRIGAAAALGKIRSPKAIPALVKAMTRQPSVDGAYQSLGRIGPAATGALISVLTTSKSAEVRSEAAAALEIIGAKATSAIPALTRALADKDETVRGQAVSAIAAIGGPQAEPAVGVLVKLLEGDPEERVQYAAARALGDLGSHAAAAIPALERAAQRDSLAAEQASVALTKIRAEMEPASP